MTVKQCGIQLYSRAFHCDFRKEIQCGDSGHCPEEDAQTTMELVLLKLKLSEKLF